LLFLEVGGVHLPKAEFVSGTVFLFVLGYGILMEVTWYFCRHI
jgi:hypothetical protein